MDINTAKEMLLRALSGVPEVNGVGIGQKNKKQTIVVLVSSHTGDSFIPATFHGFEVVRKLVGHIKIQGKETPKSQHRTLINFIIDESGSMWSCFDATVNGFNTYLTEQQSGPDQALMSVYKFSDNCSTLYKAININQIPRLVGNVTYCPNGSTALYDAIFRSVNESDAVMAADPTITRVVTVILTDGQENASRIANKENVNQLIKAKEKTGKWTFVYLGANQDAWDEASKIGFQFDNVRTYDTANMSNTMRGVSIATSNYRSSGDTFSKNFLSSVDDSLWGVNTGGTSNQVATTDDDSVTLTTTGTGSTKTK